MAKIERNYIIPLRREWRKAPRYKRTKRAVSALQTFLLKHMKVSQVKIGKELNEHIFSRGYKNPPHKVHVTVIKEDMIRPALYVDVQDRPSPSLLQTLAYKVHTVEVAGSIAAAPTDLNY